MRTTLLVIWILVHWVFPGRGEKFDDDSVQNVKTRTQAKTRLTMRLHSLGQFSYGGRLVSSNPVVDFNFTYDRKKWGLQVFKAVDLRDRGTPINFMLAVVNKNFHLTRRLTLTPSVGFLLEQSRSLADHGSDVALILTTSYKVCPELTLEYSALFGNLVITPEERDWVNRVRLLYSRHHVDLSLSYWHNNAILDAAEYSTFGASIFYSRVKLTRGILLSSGVSGLVMPYSNHKEEYPIRNGIVLTLALTVN